MIPVTMKVTPSDIRESNLAWAAGLFEGEGCIQFSGKNSVILNVTSTDMDVIHRLQDLFGGYVYGPRTRKNSKKPFWEWQLRVAEDVHCVLVPMISWLGERRTEKAYQALERLNIIFANKEANERIDHGTRSGYVKELSRGITTCDLCRKAINEEQREIRRKKKLLL